MGETQNNDPHNFQDSQDPYSQFSIKKKSKKPQKKLMKLKQNLKDLRQKLKDLTLMKKKRMDTWTSQIH